MKISYHDKKITNVLYDTHTHLLIFLDRSRSVANPLTVPKLIECINCREVIYSLLLQPFLWYTFPFSSEEGKFSRPGCHEAMHGRLAIHQGSGSKSLIFVTFCWKVMALKRIINPQFFNSFIQMLHGGGCVKF
jgi:hypothetical protein